MPLRAKLLIAAAAALSVAWAAPAAEAFVSCSFGGGSLLVGVDGAGEEARLVPSVTKIIVQHPGVDEDIGCAGGDPTRTNTDSITIIDTSSGNTVVTLDHPQNFEPGATNVGDEDMPPRFNSNEIEIDVDMGAGTKDRLELTEAGSGIENDWRYGTTGINFNVQSGFFEINDADITFAGIERNRAEPNQDDDVVSGQGGAGTGSRFARRLDIINFVGSVDDDVFTGGGGNDLLDGGYGADVLRGSAGRDTVTYASVSYAVRATIGTGGANDGGNLDESAATPGLFDDIGFDVERLIGGPKDDRLTGDKSPNVLTGGLGKDRLRGRRGNDRLKAKDGKRDRLIACGRGRRDRATVDGKDPEPISC